MVFALLESIALVSKSANQMPYKCPAVLNQMIVVL